jgi:hypothetical protein
VSSPNNARDAAIAPPGEVRRSVLDHLDHVGGVLDEAIREADLFLFDVLPEALGPDDGAVAQFQRGDAVAAEPAARRARVGTCHEASGHVGLSP